jgi:hypothetical protein
LRAEEGRDGRREGEIVNIATVGTFKPLGFRRKVGRIERLAAFMCQGLRRLDESGAKDARVLAKRLESRESDGNQ